MELRQDKRKILLVLTSTAGGAGLQSYYLAKYLPSAEIDLTVAFGEGYPLDSEFAKLGIPIVPLSFSRKISPLKNFKGFIELYRLMRRHKFQVVCMACSVAGFWGRIAAYLAGIPFRVFIIHVYASRPHQPKILQIFFLLIEKILDRLTTHYIAVSEATKVFGVSKGIMKEDKVTVIHNGVNFAGDSRPSEKQFLRKEFGFQSNGQLVGFIGRLEPQKGIPFFIRAAVLVKKKIPEAEFLIVGSGPQQTEYESLVNSLGAKSYVKFTGWRDDISRILESLDVFCLPSLWEQFPLSVLEALSLGKPVIASNVDGVSEVVVNNKTGLLVPPADSESLAEGIINLLEDPFWASVLGMEGRKLVESKFTVEQMIGRYRDFLSSLFSAS